MGPLSGSSSLSPFFGWYRKKGMIGFFKDASVLVVDLMPVVILRVAKWPSSEKELDSLRVEHILHNWEDIVLWAVQG